MKMLRGKTLMSIIYATLLALPLVSIGVRCAYVAANKNAYQSYYGETINETEYTNIEYDNLLSERNYLFSNPLLPTSENTNTSSTTYNVSNVKNFNLTTGANISSTTRIYFNINSYNPTIYFYNGGTELASYNLHTNNISFEFTFISASSISYNTEILSQNIFYDISYNQYSYLDNVFDYSVSILVDENNFGQLNFFQWFNNFLLNDQQDNLLYVRFANWYLNYAMLISLMQILFLVLMWFVNFSRKLLERGMNFYD